MKGIKITSDKALSIVEVDGLAGYQAIVGGLIEPVTLNRGADDTLYLNEEGKIIGLPVNSIATDLALNVLQWRDVIVGDVVIVGPLDEEGYDTDIEGPTVRYLRRVAREAGGRWEEAVSA